MNGSFARRVRDAGFELPEIPATASSAYVPRVQSGNLLFISGQISQCGDILIAGQVTFSATPERAKIAAEYCALNLLAQLAAAVDGDIARVRRAVRVGVFVSAPPEFAGHSAIADALSAVLTKVLGPQGAHARTSVGVASLPRGATVEADAIFEIGAP